jgi:adenylosuccinate synthase
LSSIGTTKRGIGPAYSSKASRSGLRVHHLFDEEVFAAKFRKLVEGRIKRYGHFEYDTEGEIERYKVRVHFLPFLSQMWLANALCQSLSFSPSYLLTCCSVLFITSACGAALQSLAARLKPMVTDGVNFCQAALDANKRVLVEGANALMLDIDYGTYPYVTSSSTAIGGVCTGLGLPPKKIGKTIGVVKAYTTRVGGGPFPSEQLNVRRLSSLISLAKYS